MPVPNSSYGLTAKVFHWAVVVLLAVQLPIGWLMPDIRRGMSPGTTMSLHISIGISILLLIVARFTWRLTHPVALESYLPVWQRVSSEVLHWLLYLAVLATTLTGWLFESTRGWTIHLYGAVPLPRLVEEGSSIGQAIGGWHSTAVWVLITLIALHVLAALVHLLVFRDRVMYRMLPG
jgi:cytochrome b561